VFFRVHSLMEIFYAITPIGFDRDRDDDLTPRRSLTRSGAEVAAARTRLNCARFAAGPSDS
jgi:hypothetical protein